MAVRSWTRDGCEIVNTWWLSHLLCQ